MPTRAAGCRAVADCRSGLGSVHLVTLAEAREAARANRKLARSGGDPLAERLTPAARLLDGTSTGFRRYEMVVSTPRRLCRIGAAGDLVGRRVDD